MSDLTRDILAIVGSIDFVCPDGMKIARDLIVAEITERRPHLVVSDGEPGIGMLAAEIARELDVPEVVFRPRVHQWDGPEGIQARDAKIGNVCTRAWRISCRRSRTHGSGWTVDRVERVRGRPVRRVVIAVNGDVDDSGWSTQTQIGTQEAPPT